MTKSCTCDGCDWAGNEDETNEINLNDWRQYSDDDKITGLPVGECPECGAPVYTDACLKSWDKAIAADDLIKALRDLLGDDNHPVQGGICQHCGRDYIDEFVTGNCPSDDCPHTKAVAALAKAGA